MTVRLQPPRLAAVISSLLLVLALGLLAACNGSSSSNQTTKYIAVADTANNRVVVYSSPFSNGQQATGVLGQSGFGTRSSDLTASGMNDPWTVAEDSAGNLYVSDTSFNRVLQFKPPFSNGMDASAAIGQPDLITGDFNTSKNGFNRPGGLAFDKSGNLWVADYLNCRVLEFQPPFATNMDASLVIGQSNFTSNICSHGTSALKFDTALAFDSSGNLWVADTGNNRVLEFQPPFSNGMAASIVIGQADFTSAVGRLTEDGFSGPFSIAIDGSGNLWVGDVSNGRVLEFKPPFSNGMNASLVLGQPDFTTTSSQISQSSVGHPFGVAFDAAGNLWVADAVNSRTLEFMPPFKTNQNASVVLGQTDFTSSVSATSVTGQDSPNGVSAVF